MKGVSLVTDFHEEPLVKFQEDGSASILNYNLPTTTTYQVVTLARLSIGPKRFDGSAFTPPADNYWDRFDGERGQTELGPAEVLGVLRGQTYTPLTEVMDAGLNFTAQELPTASGVKFKAANLTVSTTSAAQANLYAANKIAEGFRPVIVRRASGRQQLVFQRRPRQARPSIYLVLKLRMASFLGDYGAGETVSTTSILPGESTTIQIRDYRHIETTRHQSESVLDSYSESAMDDLQTTIETSTSTSSSFSETDIDSMEANTSANGGVNLGVVELGGEAGASASSVNTTSVALDQQMDTLDTAVSHHVQTADTHRQIEINTDVTSTETSETETTVTRNFENINKSRVLNLTFRRLNQAFVTITYLDDVALLYSNGFDTSRRTGTLGSLDAFLASVLDSDEDVDHVRSMIFTELCNITDHTGTKVSFIEQVTEKQANCIEKEGDERPVSYIRKRRDLHQTYRGKTVDGIILRTAERVLRTPALVVDALLSGGQALDRYNIELQEAAYTGAHLQNRKLATALDVIDAIEDPVEKAQMWGVMFGTCCPDGTATGDE